MNCPVCHGFIISAVPSLSPKELTIYEGEEFIIHEICGRELQRKQGELKTEDAQRNFVKKVLAQMSM